MSGNSDGTPCVRMDLESPSTSHQRPSDVILIKEESEHDYAAHQSTCQLPIKLESERDIKSETEFLVGEVEDIVKSEPLKTEDEGFAHPSWLTHQTAGSSRIPTVDDFQIKQECECDGEQSGESVKLEMDIKTESELVVDETAIAISSVESESPDAECTLVEYAASEGATSRDDPTRASWKTSSDKRDFKIKSCEANMIQMDQGGSVCRPSTSELLKIKEEPVSESPGSRDWQQSVKIESDEDVEFVSQVFNVEAEPDVKIKPQIAVGENSGLPADVTWGFPFDDDLAQVLDDALFCEFCGYQSASRADFNKHLRAHLNEKTFLCGVCGYLTNKRANLVMHQRKHSQIKPSCSGQQVSISAPTATKKFHLLCCDLCDFETFSRLQLNKHLRTHMKGEPAVCGICGFQTYGMTNLAMHMKNHQEKPFACDVCSYATIKKHNLVMHARTHRGDELYACDVCSYTTIKKHNLIMHARTHRGDGLFVCDLCGYTTAKEADLITHSKSHYDEILACDVCEYRTLRQQDFLVHKRRHHTPKQ